MKKYIFAWFCGIASIIVLGAGLVGPPLSGGGSGAGTGVGATNIGGMFYGTNGFQGSSLVLTGATPGSVSIYGGNNQGFLVIQDASSNNIFVVSNYIFWASNYNLLFTNSSIIGGTNTINAGQFWQINNGTNFINSGNINVGQNLQIAGKSWLSNSLYVSAGGAYIVGTTTNLNNILLATNATTWGGTGFSLDANLPCQFVALGTNATLLGWANIYQSGCQKGTLLSSNSSSGVITFTLPVGARLVRDQATNQPSTSLAITNGKIAQLDWFLYSHLGQTITSCVWKVQEN